MQEETDFWRDFFDTGGEPWPEEYQRRFDPTSRLQEHIARYVPRGTCAAILDVGAGPLTSLGKTHPDLEFTITAVDALADVYDRLIDEAGVHPPVRTVKCDTEHLTDRFGEHAFDVVHARNTIDHSYDPLQAISEMARVTKPGGVILLQHYPNVAELERYSGMHRWNLSVVGERFVVSRPTPRGVESSDVEVELADLLELVSTEAEHDEPNMDFVVFRRRAAVEAGPSASPQLAPR